jgi:hypothetical protein
MASTAEKLDPELWEEAKADARDAYGGHSARAMQYASKLYKARGGRYKGRKRADNRLTQWTRQDWTTKSGRPSKETGERYLPRAAIESLSSAEYGATTRAKRRGGGVGSIVAQPPSIREKTRKFRKVNPMATPAQIAARKKFAERARSGELAKMRKKNPTAAARSGMRKKRVTKKDIARADAQFEKKFGFSQQFIEEFGRLVNIYEKQGFTKDEAMKAAKNQVKAMTDALKSVKNNPTATRAPERSRTKLVENGDRKKNPIHGYTVRCGRSGRVLGYADTLPMAKAMATSIANDRNMQVKIEKN